MYTNNFFFKNLNKKKKNLKLQKYLKEILASNDETIKSLTNNYNYNYKNKLIKKFKRFNDVRIFGMGGSALGTNAIYDFLKHKIKKNFHFLSNLKQKNFSSKKNT